MDTKTSIKKEQTYIQDSLLAYLEEYQKFFPNLKEVLSQDSNILLTDRILGALYGAALGDAIGTTVEFSQTVDKETVQQCLKCPGGGPFQVWPGQVTDDTEMAYSIAHCLIELINNGLEYDLNTQAQHYLIWQNSDCFDMGNTIGNSFQYVKRVDFDENERVDYQQTGKKSELANLMIQAAKQMDSQSNGSLMRISPLAVYGVFQKNQQQYVKIVKSDSSLTHSNVFAQQITAFYCLLIRELIQNGGQRSAALEKVITLAKEYLTQYQEILIWVNEGQKQMQVQCNKGIGYVKFAFCYTISCLSRGLNYTQSMRQVLQMAGDTDTNCAIVGAVIGCCEGFVQLPKEKQIVLDFDPQNKQNKPRLIRPALYDSKYFLKLTSKLLKTKFQNQPQEQSQNSQQSSGSTEQLQNQSQPGDSNLDLISILEQYNFNPLALEKLKKNTKLKSTTNFLLGCLYGAALGDAIGGSHQNSMQIDKLSISKLLKCPGGGNKKLGEGQVSDDVQMAISGSLALTEMLQLSLQYDLNTQAKYYYHWFTKSKFKPGNTIQNAFELACKLPLPELNERVDLISNERKLYIADAMIKSARSMESTSNGSLMRLSPLGVYSIVLQNAQDVVKIVSQDISLTHSNQMIQEIGSFYCLLIRELVIQEGKRIKALEIILSFAKNHFQHYQIIEDLVEMGKTDDQSVFRQQAGAQLAFILSIYCLVHKLKFADSIAKVIMFGGDIDTNCTIVGAVIGTCEGFLNLPVEKHQILDFDYLGGKISHFEPKSYLNFIAQLINHSQLLQ